MVVRGGGKKKFNDMKEEGIGPEHSPSVPFQLPNKDQTKSTFTN